MIQQTWQGHYLDGKSADKKAVSIQLLNEGLKIVMADGVVMLWPYGEIRQVQGFYENEPVRLERGGKIPEALVIDDPRFLNSLHQFAPLPAKRFHNPAFRSLRLRLTLYAAFGIVALGIFLYLWGIPLLAGFIAPMVPIEWEKQLGQSALNVLAPEKDRCMDPELNQSMEQIVVRLKKTQNNPYPYHIILTKSPVMNAVALPGGNIVLFGGLLENTRSPEELAGVIAHEMQHISRRHVTRRIIEDSSSGLLITAITGDMTAVMVYGVKIAHTLAMLCYSRQDEEEADVGGMKMLLAAGVDPNGMIRFYETLKGKDNVPEMFKYVSTHPDVGERIVKLKAVIAGSGVQEKSRPILSADADWEHLKNRCGGKKVKK